jgi:UDP-N-acetyl-D-glucosamine dehydrogenase
MKIAICGLGYVGLPLSLQFARSGVTVLGLDIDKLKIDAISAGRSYIKHISSSILKEQVQAGNFSASIHFRRAEECEAIIICVPTPLNKNREPDISYILKTGHSIAPWIRQGSLVVLESTTYPGTTEDELRPILENISGLKAGVDFYLAYSPEREDPANPDSKVGEVPKLVGGYTKRCEEKAVQLYSHAIRTVIPVGPCKVAEAAKILENVYRSVNIALVNELKLVYEKMGIDIWAVIEAAKTKPFGFSPFYPGPGLGGHCIPIDPFYLTWKAREYGIATRFIELAGEVNTAMPLHVVNRTCRALNSIERSVKGSRILCIGLAYKPNVDDERESPTWEIMELLQEREATVEYYDSHIPDIDPMREHPHFVGKKSVAWNKEVIRSFDAVVICTAHDDLNREELSEWAKLIVDTRNAVKKAPHVWKA